MNDNSEARRMLRGSHVASADADLGAAPPADPMALTLILRRRTPLPTAGSGAAVPPMDRSEFARLHGARDEDVAAVRRFAAAHGLAVDAVDVAARSVRVSGSVARIQEAFGVRIRCYRGAGDQAYRANDGDASLPSGMADAVEAVLGLSERPVAAPRRAP
ncbi:MAG TPA: protease pro-enzyme activation domain-containing protein [Burkholderiaceae bacterium]|nr:protease pro-enzyme activation domain-containing protein [Burkholderiaceae bacterium]